MTLRQALFWGGLALLAGLAAPAAAHDSAAHGTKAATVYPTLKSRGVVGKAMVDNVSMTTAARNTIYSCQWSRGTAGYGFSWVNTTTQALSFAGKPIVEGSVEWTSYYKSMASGSTLQVGSNGLPNHLTGTFPVSSSTEAGQPQYHPNPGSISAKRLYADLPLNPTYSATPNCIGGIVGFLFTGALLFNALDADGRDAVANEMTDQCEGHPNDTSYHYHHLTNCYTDSTSGHSVQVGWALDGFGIYGPKGESGATLTNADLDECHGHTHGVTQADGTTKTVYHYHGNEEFPYVVGCFRGTRSASERSLVQTTTPANGFWYTSTASGRGFGIEVQGSSMFFGIYTYDATGADIWYVGNCMLGAATCSGQLQGYAGGTTFANLGGTASAPAATASPASYTLTVTSASAITVTITPASGSPTTYALTRFPIDGATVAGAPSWAPVSGWWWAPAYSGTGWFIESQGSVVQNGTTYSRFFAVGYAYGSTGAAGQANWYGGSGLYTNTTASASMWQGTLNEFTGGPTLTGASGTIRATDRGPATIRFSSTTTGTVILPNGQAIAIQRFQF